MIWFNSLSYLIENYQKASTVYPKKYAHGFCFVVVIHWLIFPYPSGLLHWHCGNLTIAPVPAKQPWWIWINTSCEFIMNDCITTTKQSTTKPCAYFLGYTVVWNIQHFVTLCVRTLHSVGEWTIHESSLSTFGRRYEFRRHDLKSPTRSHEPLQHLKWYANYKWCIVLRQHTDMFAFSVILCEWNGPGSLNSSSWKTRVHLSFMVNTMSTDDPVTQAAMVSTQLHVEYCG